MNYTDFMRLLADAAECKTLDEYIAECGGSLPDEYYDDGIATGDKVQLIKSTLKYIWDYSRDKSFANIYKLSGHKTYAALYRALELPTRTAENWVAGARTPPPYLMDMIAYIVLGILDQ